MKHALILFILLASLSAKATSLEEKVKAAYVLNFTRFTEWPSGVFKNKSSPLTICVLSTESFKNTLEKTVANAKNDSRKIEVIEIKETLAINKCHAVYIGQPFLKRSQNVINSLKQGSVLTIGDDESFYKNGGMISFVTFEQTIQFNINLEVATGADLKLSSRMLSLAKQVVPTYNKERN